MYYEDKLGTLADIFGCEQIALERDRLLVDGTVYPIRNDVIIALNPVHYPASWRSHPSGVSGTDEFAPDIQFTFGHEWQTFRDILPEHRLEFEQYFDLVDLEALNGLRVCDLGCGMGRWSHFLAPFCRELVVVDFSEAIFVARHNLRSASNVIYVMADIRQLPLRADFADFLFCLGVLHHLPTNALEGVRALKRYAPRLLVYLYYALDNRPRYFQAALAAVTGLRRIVSRARNPFTRSLITSGLTAATYLPLLALGNVLSSLGRAPKIPLYETYRGKSLKRIRQDVYDRFFTTIEQRFSREEILTLRDTFSEVVISGALPYWHFVCQS